MPLGRSGRAGIVRPKRDNVYYVNYLHLTDSFVKPSV